MAGHPPDLSEEQKEAMAVRRREGASWALIAREARAGQLAVPAFKVHWSTIKKHLKHLESELPATYAEMEKRLRQKSEANLRATLRAIDRSDWKRVEGLMRARGAITQAIKGLLVSRDLYRLPGVSPSTLKQEEAREQSFLAGLAAAREAGQAVANGGGDKGHGVGRADSRAIDAAPRAQGQQADLHADPVDQAA